MNENKVIAMARDVLLSVGVKEPELYMKKMDGTWDYTYIAEIVWNKVRHQAMGLKR